MLYPAQAGRPPDRAVARVGDRRVKQCLEAIVEVQAQNHPITNSVPFCAVLHVLARGIC
jgi:hypothetical protein